MHNLIYSSISDRFRTNDMRMNIMSYENKGLRRKRRTHNSRLIPTKRVSERAEFQPFYFYLCRKKVPSNLIQSILQTLIPDLG